MKIVKIFLKIYIFPKYLRALKIYNALKFGNFGFQFLQIGVLEGFAY